MGDSDIGCWLRRNGYQLFRSEETANSKIVTKSAEVVLSQLTMSEPELIRWLESKILGTFSIHDDGTINVDGDVNLEGKLGEIRELGELGGIKFERVTGDFNCQKNHLISLKGTPVSVGGDFLCSSNKLSSLAGAPIEVGGKFDCSDNPLSSLQGFPESIRGGFFCKTANLDDFLGSNLPDHFQKYVPSEWWERHLEKKRLLEEEKRKLTPPPEGPDELVLW